MHGCVGLGQSVACFKPNLHLDLVSAQNGLVHSKPGSSGWANRHGLDSYPKHVYVLHRVDIGISGQTEECRYHKMRPSNVNYTKIINLVYCDVS